MSTRNKRLTAYAHAKEIAGHYRQIIYVGIGETGGRHRLGWVLQNVSPSDELMKPPHFYVARTLTQDPMFSALIPHALEHATRTHHRWMQDVGRPGKECITFTFKMKAEL